MLAIALIFALTAHSALGKPTGNCIFMCEAQPGFGGSGAYTQPGVSGAYTQPGVSGAYSQPGVSGAYSQPGASGAYSQPGSGYAMTLPYRIPQPAYGQGSGGSYQPRFGRIETLDTEAVYPQQPAHQETIHQQVPVSPEIDGMFTHSSSRSSFESNQGYLKIHQPAVTRTVISEPIRQPIRRPARICQDVYDPCV